MLFLKPMTHSPTLYDHTCMTMFDRMSYLSTCLIMHTIYQCFYAVCPKNGIFNIIIIKMLSFPSNDLRFVD